MAIICGALVALVVLAFAEAGMFGDLAPAHPGAVLSLTGLLLWVALLGLVVESARHPPPKL